MSSINQLDDIEAAFTMMRKGVPDAKRFAKYFPHTTCELCEQRITQSQLVEDIRSTYVDLNVKSRGMYIDHMTCMELAKDSAYWYVSIFAVLVYHYS